MAHSGNAIGSQQHIEDLKNEAESLQKVIQVSTFVIKFFFVTMKQCKSIFMRMF